MPVIDENAYTRAEKLLPELTTAYNNGESTNALAKKYGIRREAISTVLAVAGVGPSTPGRDKVLKYVDANHGLSVDELALRLDLPKSTISRYLRGTPQQRLVITKKKTDYTTYSDKQKIAALKEAWKMLSKEQKTKGMSRARYDKLVGHREDRPSSTTFIRRWGLWGKACEQAGIVAAAPRRSSYEQEYSNDDILDCISRFIEETGKTAFHPYAAWAREHGCASGPLVVVRHGSWSEARRRAIERSEEQKTTVAPPAERSRSRKKS